jgi:predicted PurR-regulated permease PerM
LGVVAGILEIVPYFGPIVSAAFAMTVALNTSFVLFLVVGVFFFVVQQIEGNFLVPQIMKRSVHLHPITVIFSILVGYQFFGITGAISAIPVATIVLVLYKETYERK